MYTGDLFTTWFAPNGRFSGNTYIKITKRVTGLLEVCIYEWTVYVRCKPTRNSAMLLVILINVLPKDGPLGPKHIVNKSHIHKINKPYL